ncbi:MAG: hypothetical protein CL840_18175 [Crocinitomicaceae bacterium]|nr:hypothetical protein [Crocinitomicaceae bacterium]
MPIFPNTVIEGRDGGGYDVNIDGNIYFQFKIPKHITRRNAKNPRQWPVYNMPYYRIKVNTNSRQFELLKDLQTDPFNKVYYATPNFHTDYALSTNYQFDRIVSSSSLFPIRNFPNHGSGHHQLIYRPNFNWGKLFSEPKEIKKERTISPIELFEVQKGSRFTIFKQAKRISEILGSNEIGIQGDIPLNDNNPIELVKAVYNILLTNYNIHWYPVISRRQ